MSYEIIYNAFSVRQGEAVIPYVISGSNNVYTMDYATGREVRARDLTDIGFFPKGMKRRFKPIRKGYMFLEVD